MSVKKRGVGENAMEKGKAWLMSGIEYAGQARERDTE